MMKIEKFSFGLITIDGKDFENDVLLLPPRVLSPWWRKKGHQLDKTDLEEVAAYRPDILVVGTGASGMMSVPAITIRNMELIGVKVEVFPTDQACVRFNGLVETGGKVAGAMHLTC